MASRVAILTLIGNTKKDGHGPGHTAVVVDKMVYSFENAGDWFSKPSKEKSGWVILSTSKYLAKNTFRPVVVQEMKPTLVNANQVLKYVKDSKADDDDYLSSGVCSSQVSNAIDAGTKKTFNPSGPDTPYGVFKLAQKQSLASSTYYIWNAPRKNKAAEKLATDYRSVKKTGSGILRW